MQQNVELVTVTKAPIESQQDAKPIDTPVKEEEKVEEPGVQPTPEWKNVGTFTGATFNSTVINIINTIIGAGVLSIAYSIMKAGVLGSVLMIIAVFVPSVFTAYYLSVTSIYTNEAIYGSVGTKLCNKLIGGLSDFSLILLDFGIDVAYMNVLFNQVIDILKELFNVDLSNYKTLVSALVSFIILFPLVSIKTMDALKFTSSVAIVCVIIFVIACIFMGIQGFQERGWDLYTWPRQATDLSTAFAVFVLCFCSHVNTSKITSELHFPEKSKFKNRATKMLKATLVAYVFCALSYLFVGICGYMAFGNKIEGSILDAMRDIDVWYKPVIRVGYGLVVLFSYPLLGFPACCTIDSWIYKTDRSLVRRLVEGFIWVALTLIVCLLIPSLSDIFGVTGSFCGVLLTFIWPAVYFIAMCNKEKKKPVENRVKWFRVRKWEEVVAWIILVVGIIVCFYATYLEVMNLVKKFSQLSICFTKSLN